jgi:hypothetical protein
MNKPATRAKVPELMLGPDLADVTVKSDIFAGMTFCAHAHLRRYLF